MTRRVLLPVPDRDFDVTEIAVPWHYLKERGCDVVFATETGATAPAADPRLLDGVVFGRLGAADGPKALYRRLEEDQAFNRTVAWGDIDPTSFDALLLPGGHAPGMRQYLGSKTLQDQVGAFWRLDRPVGAICHGVLVLARTTDPRTGRSVLADRRTTSLTKSMERTAFWATACASGATTGPIPRTWRTKSWRPSMHPDSSPADRGLRRDDADSDTTGFTVTDGNYISARWPGDAYTFARRFCELLG